MGWTMSFEQVSFPEGALDGFASRVGTAIQASTVGRGLRIALACAEFNGGITCRLLEGALAGLKETRVDRSDLTLVWVPGAFELPIAARGFALKGVVDAVICLGAVVRGDTGHYDFVAGQCAAGIQRVQLDTGVPVIFGVLTTDTLQQALERSLPDDTNKGYEAATTAVKMVRLLSHPMLS